MTPTVNMAEFVRHQMRDYSDVFANFNAPSYQSKRVIHYDLSGLKLKSVSVNVTELNDFF